MSNPAALNYRLIVRRDGRRRVGPTVDFDRTAKALVGLYLEGFGPGDIELVVGIIGRPVSPDEQAAVVARAAELASS